jgi:hypothetical protein
VPAADGHVDAGALEAKLGPDVAAIMLTNPNTCGLFEREIVEIAEACTRPAPISIATARISTPSSARCGRAISASTPCTSTCTRPSRRRMAAAVPARPGRAVGSAGAVRAAALLVIVDARASGSPRVEHAEGTQAQAFGRMCAFPRPDGHVRARARLHAEPWRRRLRQASRTRCCRPTTSAPRSSDVMSAPFGGPCMHEALFDDTCFLKDTGVTTLDFAKAMIDEGYHPMTMYFPLVVHGAMLIEPTESESKRTGTTGKTFKMTSFTPLNDQVDAQPLIMTSQTIAGHGTHNVVYVATESNSIYAIDADSGKVLLKKTFGNPVPMSALPGKCSNNGPNVGITSTPVIDAGNGTMYVMVYDYDKGTTPVYRLHALDLSTLADLVTPVVVKASAKLSSGKTYNFDAAVTRQRPALLLANGHVYAGFGSFCDAANDISRGWVLGWQTGTLTPLANNELTDKLATSPDDFFLSAVWMSGYGLASGGTNGDIYFVTGNSDSGSKIRDGGVNNVAESVVQMSPDLSTVESVFTPDDSNSLDASDKDFGSGGALLLPPQTGQSSDLLVAAGKDGYMYFLNADNLDNNTTGPNRILGTYSIDNCWCGESYFTGSDGIGRIVSSGNNNVSIWRIVTGSKPKLVNTITTNGISGSQDPGFFTSVSTNGTVGKNPVIWAVGQRMEARTSTSRSTRSRP